METIKRYLIRVNIFASKENGESTLIKSEDVETDSGTIVYIPDIKLFADGIKINMTLKFIETRNYKESLSIHGMIELVKD